MHRFTDHQKYLLQAAGINGTFADIQRYFANLITLIASDLKTEALQTIGNMQYAMFMNINKIDIRHLAFAVLVDEFPIGTQVTDYSEEALVDLVKRMGQAGLTEQMVHDELGALKKNSILL